MPNGAAHSARRSLKLRLSPPLSFTSVSPDVLLSTCAAELAGSTQTRSMLRGGGKIASIEEKKNDLNLIYISTREKVFCLRSPR